MSNIRLKEIREDNKLTQKEFAECINLKQEKIRDIENSKAKVTVEIAIAIEDKFSINLRWLLSGRGDKSINEKFCINVNDYPNVEDIKELLGLLKEAPKSWIQKENERLKKSLIEVDKIF
ncbi:helix-turn-helix transcriptional regulator [Aliarcobacter butzleri]|uniref:Helix-turn-helix transcriptional regulator n=1 Tax=Aliarcobacter butzleri TaxID=28197 RepID=A0AAW7PX41_9BACT|nr:helix-turn-helix transcriptional regulator [Aliarcobacter butzleri]MDN5070448.1 helix-turn-helix transcriptional regulator [Aliarcobacter butzleri]